MKKQELPEVSTKNTKEQILAAYSQALEQLNQKVPSIAELQKTTEKTQLIDKVTKTTNDSIIIELGSLKSKVISQLDNLASNLLVEFKKFTDTQAAIAFEKQHLEELYGIKESAQSLAALIQAREENKFKLDEELKTKRAEIETYVANQKQSWKESQEEFDRNQKETKANVEKQRAREEEDYAYNRDLTRRKENDAQQQKRELEEKQFTIRLQDIDNREKQLVEQEQQVKDLKLAVESHAKLLQNTVKEAEEKLTAELAKSYEFEKKLLQKDYDSQLSLKTQAIESYISKIKEQDALIKELTTRSDQATRQVQDIAVKALESSQKVVYQAAEVA